MATALGIRATSGPPGHQSLGNAYPPASLSMCVICRQIHTAPGRPRASPRRRPWAAGQLRVGRGTRTARAGRRGCSLRRAGYVRQAAAAASPPAAAAARSVKWSSKCICRWGGFWLFLPKSDSLICCWISF